MIGFVRRILDFMFFKIYEWNFIYDVFVIFMVEVLVNINNRLLVLVLIDVVMFFILILVILFI